MVTRKKTSKAGSSKSATRRAAHAALFMRVARPDPPDARDRPFRPQVGVAPAATLFPSTATPFPLVEISPRATPFPMTEMPVTGNFETTASPTPAGR